MARGVQRVLVRHSLGNKYILILDASMQRGDSAAK
jgi:hypothetical protein